MEDYNDRFFRPRGEPPHGMEPYDLGGENDLGALSYEQQQKLNDFKIKTRFENEAYLRQHPEIDCMIHGFISEVLQSRPDNLRQFAAEYFTDPNLSAKVEKQLTERQQSRKTEVLD